MRQNYKDFTIYLTRHVQRKLIKMLSLCCREFLEKIKENEGKYWMVDDYMLDWRNIRFKKVWWY